MFRCWRSRGVATGCRAYHMCGVGTCSVYPRHLSPPERKATRIPKPVWPQGRSGWCACTEPHPAFRRVLSHTQCALTVCPNVSGC